MADLTVQGVQIILPQRYTSDPTIGLFDYDAVSCLAWSEVPLSGNGITGLWASNILLKNGIGDIEESSDLSRGGNLAEYGGLTISVANAENLMQSLKNLQINLTGLSAIVTDFIGTVDKSDLTERAVRFTGVIEDIKWGDTTLTLSLRNSLYKRETNLSVTNADGVTTPICFGKLTPPLTKIVDGVFVASTDILNLAKFTRTLDTYDDTTYNNSYFDNDSVSYPNVKIFPIDVIWSGGITYSCRMPGVAGKVPLPAPVDIYVIESGGQIREVTSWSCTNGAGFYNVMFTIRDVFLTELIDTGDNRTWVRFVKVGREYAGDTWPCKDFLKAADGTAATTPELHSFVDEKYNRIADFGFTVKDSAENNTLEIDGQQCSNDIDSLDSFLVLPVTSFSEETILNLSDWDAELSDYSNYFVGSVNGFYANKPVDTISGSLINASNVYDKMSTTSAKHYVAFSRDTGSFKWGHAFKFGLPVLPKDVEIESVHVGIKLSTNTINDPPATIGTSFGVYLFRFAYTKTMDKVAKQNITTNGGVVVDDIPDFYYSDNVSTNNLNFFKETVGYSKLTGYTFFKINSISSKMDYDCFINGGIFIERHASSIFEGEADSNIDIYELCIIFKLASSDIKKEIYTPLAGRTFYNTWQSRKTSTALIENPKDIIEHCCRLQNWSENTPIPFDWGKQYATNESGTWYDKIKITGDGSFDSINLNYLTAQGSTVAMEITDAAKQTTTAIKKKLCDSFGLCSYQDAEGYECLETLELTNPSETITLADQIGAIGDVIEPRAENIFCQPVVNYLYDHANGKFMRHLEVKNIDATEWKAEYTPGYLLADGQIVWNSCKIIYDKYRIITPCPADFTDQICTTDYTTAVNYAKRKISWMDKARLPTITVAYSKGRDYNLFKHIMVQLPRHTNNILVECVIEKIVKSKNTNTVKIDFVILGNTEDAWYDTVDSPAIVNTTINSGDGAVINQ